MTLLNRNAPSVLFESRKSPQGIPESILTTFTIERDEYAENRANAGALGRINWWSMTGFDGIKTVFANTDTNAGMIVSSYLPLFRCGTVQDTFPGMRELRYVWPGLTVHQMNVRFDIDWGTFEVALAKYYYFGYRWVRSDDVLTDQNAITAETIQYDKSWKLTEVRNVGSAGNDITNQTSAAQRLTTQTISTSMKWKKLYPYETDNIFTEGRTTALTNVAKGLNLQWTLFSSNTAGNTWDNTDQNDHRVSITIEMLCEMDRYVTPAQNVASYYLDDLTTARATTP